MAETGNATRLRRGRPSCGRASSERARLLIPLSSVGTQALEALLCPLLVEAGKGMVLRPALTPSIKSSLGTSAGLRPSVMSVSILVRAPGEPGSRILASWGIRVVCERSRGRRGDVEVVEVDLEAPDGHGVVDADVPRGLHGQVGVDRDVADAALLLREEHLLAQYAPRMAVSKLQ